MLINESYCHKVDLWGLGVILHELLSTELPFFSTDENTYKSNIINQPLVLNSTSLWDTVSMEAKDLIYKLLDKNPLTRPSAAQVLQHPWLNNQH